MYATVARRSFPQRTAVAAAIVFLSVLSLAAENVVWVEKSFEDFIDGRLGDGGANTYVSKRGRIQLINNWDLNQDGYLDLVFSNTHSHREKLDAVIYWGNGRDFDISRSSQIPNDGAQRATASDLNQDGRLDLVLPNYTNGTWDGMDSYVYYGGIDELKAKKNDSEWGFYPFSRKLTLPTRAAQMSAVADLNKDGYADIVFALSAGFWEYRVAGGDGGYESPSRIYWGSKQGYRSENRQDLPAQGCSAVSVDDLNQDGWPDIVFANQEREGNPDVNSYIYWGGSEGFDPARRAELPTHKVHAVALGDVNVDGWTDVAFANGHGPVSYIYLSQAGRFDPQRRLEFATSDARDCAIADFNRDGTADVFFTNHQTAGNPLTLSYLYWGGKDGFSADNRQEFETVGAWGLSAADLNHDDWKDLVISNYKEHFSFDVPSYIYWNSPDGFSPTARTSLFTHGAVGNTVADFDGDGHPDLLVNNTVSRSRGGISPIFVYWGNQDGAYSPEQRISLPAVDPYEWASGDLNDDGWMDLVVSNFGETVRWLQESFIYWGTSSGFSAERRSGLSTHGSAGASLADLDRDGYLDVVMANTSAEHTQGAFIYWGSADGFATPERTEMPSGSSGSAVPVDLNYDGFLDLLFGSMPSNGIPVYWGDGTRNFSADRRSFIPGTGGFGGPEVADLNRDGLLDLVVSRGAEAGRRRTTGYVYWADEKGQFTVDRRSAFETEGVITITVADVNQDGWLDLLCPNYNTGSSRATLSRIFLGGPDGFPAESMFTLPTSSGAGSMVADFNHDGYADILFICHRSEGDPDRIGQFGDHVTDSFLYWGGPQGFQVKNRLEIPARGPHFDSVVDLGNIYDRGLEFDYISSTHHYGRRSPKNITWRAETPHGSSVRLQIRTAASEAGLQNAAWIGPAGLGTYYERPSRIGSPDPSHSWIQYRAVLATPNGAGSPILDDVTVVFR